MPLFDPVINAIFWGVDDDDDDDDDAAEDGSNPSVICRFVAAKIVTTRATKDR